MISKHNLNTHEEYLSIRMLVLFWIKLFILFSGIILKKSKKKVLLVICKLFEISQLEKTELILNFSQFINPLPKSALKNLKKKKSKSTRIKK